MSNLANFESGRQKILSAPYSRLKVRVPGFMSDWLNTTYNTTGISPTDVINQAIGLAGHSQLAIKHGLQMVLRDGKGVPHELPLPVCTVEQQETDEIRSPWLTQSSQSWLHWLREELTITPETAVYNGIRVLGAVATLPSAELIIPEFGLERRLQIRLPASLLNAPSLPNP